MDEYSIKTTSPYDQSRNSAIVHLPGLEADQTQIIHHSRGQEDYHRRSSREDGSISVNEIDLSLTGSSLGRQKQGPHAHAYVNETEGVSNTSGNMNKAGTQSSYITSSERDLVDREGTPKICDINMADDNNSDNLRGTLPLSGAVASLVKRFQSIATEPENPDKPSQTEKYDGQYSVTDIKKELLNRDLGSNNGEAPEQPEGCHSVTDIKKELLNRDPGSNNGEAPEQPEGCHSVTDIKKELLNRDPCSNNGEAPEQPEGCHSVTDIKKELLNRDPGSNNGEAPEQAEGCHSVLDIKKELLNRDPGSNNGEAPEQPEGCHSVTDIKKELLNRDLGSNNGEAPEQPEGCHSVLDIKKELLNRDPGSNNGEAPEQPEGCHSVTDIKKELLNRDPGSNNGEAPEQPEGCHSVLDIKKQLFSHSDINKSNVNSGLEVRQKSLEKGNQIRIIPRDQNTGTGNAVPDGNLCEKVKSAFLPSEKREVNRGIINNTDSHVLTDKAITVTNNIGNTDIEAEEEIETIFIDPSELCTNRKDSTLETVHKEKEKLETVYIDPNELEPLGEDLEITFRNQIGFDGSMAFIKDKFIPQHGDLNSMLCFHDASDEAMAEDMEVTWRNQFGFQGLQAFGTDTGLTVGSQTTISTQSSCTEEDDNSDEDSEGDVQLTWRDHVAWMNSLKDESETEKRSSINKPDVKSDTTTFKMSPSSGEGETEKTERERMRRGVSRDEGELWKDLLKSERGLVCKMCPLADRGLDQTRVAAIIDSMSATREALFLFQWQHENGIFSLEDILPEDDEQLIAIDHKYKKDVLKLNQETAKILLEVAQQFNAKSLPHEMVNKLHKHNTDHRELYKSRMSKRLAVSRLLGHRLEVRRRSHHEALSNQNVEELRKRYNQGCLHYENLSGAFGGSPLVTSGELQAPVKGEELSKQKDEETKGKNNSLQMKDDGSRTEKEPSNVIEATTREDVKRSSINTEHEMEKTVKRRGQTEKGFKEDEQVKWATQIKRGSVYVPSDDEDEERLLGAYSLVMSQNLPDSEEESYSEEENSSPAEICEEVIVPGNAEDTELRNTLTNDIRSHIKALTSDNFKDLLSSYREERHNLQATGTLNKRESLWRHRKEDQRNKPETKKDTFENEEQVKVLKFNEKVKVENKECKIPKGMNKSLKQRDMEESLKTDASIEQEYTSLSMSTGGATEDTGSSGIAQASMEVTEDAIIAVHRDYFEKVAESDADFLASLSAKEQNIDDETVAQMLSEHLLNVESLRKLKEQNAQEYERRLKEKLKRGKKDYEEINQCDIISSERSEYNQKDEEHERVFEDEISLDSEMLDSETEKELSRLSEHYMSEINRNKKTISVDEARELIKRYRESQRDLIVSRDQRRVKMDEILKERLEAKNVKNKKQKEQSAISLKEEVSQMDEAFYRDLVQQQSQNTLDEKELGKLVEQHLDRVDALQKRIRKLTSDERESRRLKREEKRRQKHLEKSRSAEVANNAKSLVQEQKESAQQVRMLRDREKKKTDAMLEERLARRKQFRPLVNSENSP